VDFRISDTFTDSLNRLTGDEQKAVKTTAFDLQLNPANPGMSFHKLNKAKDKNFWSVRVGGDIRLIVHKSSSSLLLCYVDHHDKAYAWAERRKLETHPQTGAAQLVEIRELTKEIIVPKYVEEEAITADPAETETSIPSAPLFSHRSDDIFLEMGVPPEWISDVKGVDEDALLDLIEHLPAEAAEGLLELATAPTGSGRLGSTGGAIMSLKDQPHPDPYGHPDAQRRFRLMTNVEELETALEYPWEKWTVFLHPEQRNWAERDYNGPAKVAGSAGTGKTVVALHRAAHLARTNPDARILLTTFTDTLARALKTKIRRLLGGEIRVAEQIEVHSVNALGERLYKAQVGDAVLVSRQQVGEIIHDASTTIGNHKFSPNFLLAEWEQVVDAWQLETWEDYRDVARLGRKTRLPEAQRQTLWSIFEIVRKELRSRNLVTQAEQFNALAQTMAKKTAVIFDYAVVDESQDISVAHLRFFAALGKDRPNALFFAGDLGQRIFQQPFSWKSLGVDIRGRSRTLRVNYRTSHQIRTQTDRLLGPVVTDVDGNTEERNNTVSVFNGIPPVIDGSDDEAAEVDVVGQWLAEQAENGVVPHEFGVFVRSVSEIPRARLAVEKSGMPYKVLDDDVETTSGHVSISTMHLAKGLEYRAVAVMACDDEVVPLQARMEAVGDDADLQEVYETERHLLYVACTRARDHLLVSGVNPVSEFLDDLLGLEA